MKMTLGLLSMQLHNDWISEVIQVLLLVTSNSQCVGQLYIDTPALTVRPLPTKVHPVKTLEDEILLDMNELSSEDSTETCRPVV